MNKKDFEILMNSLYSNNQLFIPKGQTIKEWIDNAFLNALNEAINYTRCCESVKGEQVPTFDEFIDKFNLEADRDNEYFFDGEYFDAMGLYYKYAEHYGINP
jgi:hypothetical protein